MRHIHHSILLLICLTVFVACSKNNQAELLLPCKNQIESSFIPLLNDEWKLFGNVKSIRVEEQIYEFESHFVYEHDKPLPKKDYEFDQSGKKIKETEYNIYSEPGAPTTFEYDEKGFLKKENHFGFVWEKNNISGISKEPYRETVYTYNEDGTNKEIFYRDIKDNEIWGEWKFSNNVDNNYFEFIKVSSEKWDLRLGIKRDNECRISDVYLYEFKHINMWSSKTVYLYDEKDNPVSLERYAPLGILLEQRKYEYEYDNQANWIKKSDFALIKNNGKSDWKLMNVVYRKIEYYDTK